MNTPFSRRDLLKSSVAGFGFLAFSGLAARAVAAEKTTRPLAPKSPHFPPRAKRVIFLSMEGAPSHVDTFDYKPKLMADSGKPFSGSRIGRGGTLLGSPWKFNRHGDSGLWVSELFPEVAKQSDHICMLNAVTTDIPAHPQAYVAMHCGMSQFRRPSVGSWVLYGLGSENETLPGYITISPPGNNGGSANYGSAFLPAVYQGTRIGQANRPVADAMVANIRSKEKPSAQRVQLDFVQSLNRGALERDPENAGVEGLIESYELAFRMQDAVPKLLDISEESAETKKLYGIGDGITDDFGRQCLLARRCAEAGVRFVEICHPGWDQHRNLKVELAKNCKATDKPIAGLLADLHSRGLLKDTLVIWGGEFGRTPYAQGTDGRDHNHKGYTMWFAGGGVKGGHAHGRTDDYGYEAIDGKVHTHDWHATVLHILGFDHEKLTYRYAGRDMRLTDVKGVVVKEILT